MVVWARGAVRGRGCESDPALEELEDGRADLYRYSVAKSNSVHSFAVQERTAGGAEVTEHEILTLTLDGAVLPGDGLGTDLDIAGLVPTDDDLVAVTEGEGSQHFPLSVANVKFQHPIGLQQALGASSSRGSPYHCDAVGLVCQAPIRGNSQETAAAATLSGHALDH